MVSNYEEVRKMSEIPGWSLLKRILLAFFVAFVVYLLMLFVVGLASIRNLYPDDPTIKLLLLCLGTNGISSCSGVLAGSARLFDQRLKMAVIIGAVLLAYDVISVIALVATGRLSLDTSSDAIWFSVAWASGIAVAILVRAYRPSIVVDRVGAGQQS